MSGSGSERAASGSGSERTGARRELGLALLLLVVGGALVLIAAGQTWWSASSQPPGFPTVRLARTGRQVAPGAWACGILGLAGVVGALATRRTGRVVTGAIVALAGLSASAVSAAGWWLRGSEVAGALASVAGNPPASAYTDYIHGTAWPVISVVGGLAVAAGGVLVCLRGRRWRVMGARYDSPYASASPDPAARGSGGQEKGGTDLWKALDRGEDPTR